MKRADRERESNRWTWILVALLFIGLLFLIYLLLRAGAYERMGDSHVDRLEFGEALGLYQAALEKELPWVKPRLLYKIGMCYEQLGEKERANDFYYQIIRDYPGHRYARLAEQAIERIFRNIMSVMPSLVGGTGGTRLVRARRRFQAAYLSLMKRLKSNTSGVPGALKESYLAYKKAWEEYRNILAAEYQAALRKRMEKTGKESGH